MNNKRIIRNIGVSMLMKPISMILSFIYTPLALAFLGEEKYGVWIIILNIISWINYFDIGIGNGLRNKLAESITIDDKENAQIYVSTAYIGTTIISVIFFCLITLIWEINELSVFFKLNTVNENTDFIVLISVFFVCINFILSLSKTTAYSIQQPGLISVIGVIGQVLQIVIIYILTRLFTDSLLAVSLMYGIVSLFENILLYYVLSQKYNYLIPKIKKTKFKYMKSLLTLGIGFFVMQMCSLVLNTTDSLLISKLYGSTEVTPYNMIYKVFNMFVQIHGIIIMPLWSAYTEATSRCDAKWTRNTIKKVNIITVLASIGVCIGIGLFEPFADMWLGKELEYSKLTIIIVAIYMITQMFANNYSSFLCGVGYIRVSVILASVGAIINIPLSIYFAQGLDMHISGIIMGSLIVMLSNVIILPLVTYKWISKKERVWELKDK